LDIVTNIIFVDELPFYSSQPMDNSQGFINAAGKDSRWVVVYCESSAPLGICSVAERRRRICALTPAMLNVVSPCDSRRRRAIWSFRRIDIALGMLEEHHAQAWVGA
jgi:hypothetical protein